jgi:serine/threonine protein kinase
MGEVYPARDNRLGRDVALKVSPGGVAADAERLARFEHETRIVAGLNHPNIVTLYSVEDENSIRLLTMGLVDGQERDPQIIPGGMSITRVIELAIARGSARQARGAPRSHCGQRHGNERRGVQRRLTACAMAMRTGFL